MIYIYVIFNMIGFISMFLDKRYAIQHKWRIPERTLLLIALFGPFGSFLGMNICRHKTKHLKFIILVPLFVVLHIALYFYVF